MLLVRTHAGCAQGCIGCHPWGGAWGAQEVCWLVQGSPRVSRPGGVLGALLGRVYVLVHKIHDRLLRLWPVVLHFLPFSWLLAVHRQFSLADPLSVLDGADRSGPPRQHFARMGKLSTDFILPFPYGRSHRSRRPLLASSCATLGERWCRQSETVLILLNVFMHRFFAPPGCWDLGYALGLPQSYSHLCMVA